MKNKGLIITLIIVLSVFALALSFFFIAVIQKDFKFNWNFNYNISEELIYDETYENNFEIIDIVSTMGDINIKESEDNRVRVEVYGEEKYLKTDVTNNRLNIEYKDKGCFGICFNKKGAKINVYLPKDFNKKINIENDYGNITVGDFSKATLEVSEDCGDVKVGKVLNAKIENAYGNISLDEAVTADIEQDCGDIDINKVGDIKIENNLGDTDIKSITNYAKIEADCGDIKIDNLNINKNSSIKNDLGDIEIHRTNDIFIDSSVDLGNNKVKNSNRKSNITLKIDNDCGDVNVNN